MLLLDPISSAVKGLVLGVARLFGDSQHDERCKERLRAMLTNEGFQFGRTIDVLAAGIGEDVKTTKRLLLAIGARPSQTNKDLWTLKPAPKRH
jgi:hypothetical protein